MHNLKQTQLYISKPLFFFGDELNGLFSAQFIPNNETMGIQWGKKIFGFSEFVHQNQQNSPKTKIDEIILQLIF